MLNITINIGPGQCQNQWFGGPMVSKPHHRKGTSPGMQGKQYVTRLGLIVRFNTNRMSQIAQQPGPSLRGNSVAGLRGRTDRAYNQNSHCSRVSFAPRHVNKATCKRMAENNLPGRLEIRVGSFYDKRTHFKVENRKVHSMTADNLFLLMWEPCLTHTI